jgi:hypothetical protein
VIATLGSTSCRSRVQPDAEPDLRRLGVFWTHLSELVVFSSYEVVERAPYPGETRAWIGDATWKGLDRATLEALVGRKV